MANGASIIGVNALKKKHINPYSYVRRMAILNGTTTQLVAVAQSHTHTHIQIHAHTHTHMHTHTHSVLSFRRRMID